MVRKYHKLPEGSAFEEFTQLLLHMVMNQSLMVSIPILVAWVRILGTNSLIPLDSVWPLIPTLLDLCSSRLVRYENMSEDSVDPIILFLLEDTDTLPERHAFLGNYRRYCCQIIESIVLFRPQPALEHILSGTENVLQTLYEGHPALDSM